MTLIALVTARGLSVLRTTTPWAGNMTNGSTCSFADAPRASLVAVSPASRNGGIVASQGSLKGGAASRTQERPHPLVDDADLCGSGQFIGVLRFAGPAHAGAEERAAHQADASKGKEQV